MTDTERPARIQVTDSTLIPERGQNMVFSAWRISIGLALATLLFLIIFKPDPYLNILVGLSSGLPVTFGVTISAILLSSVIGLLAGLGQISRITVINRAVTVYVEIIRGIPLMVQILFFYFGLSIIQGPDGKPLFDAFGSAVVAMSVCYGAYMGEIFRAGIQSIPRGQMEAALALGLSRSQAFRLVIVPQTVKVVIPALGNEFIAMLKDSSLVSAISLVDLARRGKEIASSGVAIFQAYAMIALVYLVITLTLSRLVGFIEERMHRNGR